MKNIPLIKPYLPPRSALLPAIEEIIYSGYIAEGEEVKKFEKRLEKIFQTPFCLSLNSGTAAIHIALCLVGVGEGDQVISTALTAEPTNTTIALTGAKVVFADVDNQTGLISPQSIEAKINDKTKAIIVVHYAGMVCDMNKINHISKKYNIPVIEDAAHAFLSKYKEKYVGYYSKYACYSFQAIKQLTTVDGGLLILNNEEEYSRAKKMRWFGLDKSLPRLENNIIEPGFKYHMNNVNAAIGNTQLDFLKENTFKYIDNGKFYDEALKNIEGIELINYYADTEPSYWLYTILVDRRDEFIEHLHNFGITASQLHLRNDRHAVFKDKSFKPGLESFYNRFVHIPCGWWVSREDREYIVDIIKRGW